MCQPTSQGDLRVLHLHTMNVALLVEWINRHLCLKDMVSQVLRDKYGSCMLWESTISSASQASTFRVRLQKVLLRIQGFFSAKLGDGSSFCFWLDNWSGQDRLREAFPRLFAQAQNHSATVGECWDATWCPLLEGHLIDQWTEE